MLMCVILVEGFVTISAEILTIRQLLPMVGNSVIVTSLIIGIFLLFLAYGYRRGGQYQENYVEILKRNFMLAAIWLGIGLSYIFINLFFAGFRNYISTEILVALLMYLIIVTAPLVYILGQTVPITMNLIKEVKPVGAIGGKILHLSTMGSFMGAVLTSLLLMNYLGVAATVFINFCLLAILTILLFVDKKKEGIRIISLSVAFIIVFAFNIYNEKQTFITTNTYANYEVIKTGKDTLLRINGSHSSLLTPEGHGFPYIELIKRILFQDLQLTNKDILVLGAGGFTLSAAGTHGNKFTYVDIDKDIEKVVKKHFLNTIRGAFVASDAREFLNLTPKKFDVIISDVYSNQRAIPAHLLTQEYFSQIKNKLQKSGFAIFNIIARPTLDDAYSRRLDNTVRSVFGGCMSIPIKYTNTINNIVYVCKNEARNAENTQDVYTDDLNRATLDFFNALTK